MASAARPVSVTASNEAPRSSSAKCLAHHHCYHAGRPHAAWYIVSTLAFTLEYDCSGYTDSRSGQQRYSSCPAQCKSDGCSIYANAETNPNDETHTNANQGYRQFDSDIWSAALGWADH